MEASSSKSVYISSGANRASHGSAIANRVSELSGEHQAVVAYGSGRGVAIWDCLDSKDHGISVVLPGHSAKVTAVHFLSGDDNDDLNLISGDEKGSLLSWTRSSEISNWSHPYKISSQHTGTLTSIYSLPTPSSSSSHLIFSSSGAGIVEIHLFTPSSSTATCTLIFTIPCPTPTRIKPVTSVTAAYLPDTKSILVAIARTEGPITFWTGSSIDKSSSNWEWSPKGRVEGHTDWVRCLSFCDVPTEEGKPKEMLLASGAQDYCVRLWSICSISLTSEESGDIKTSNTPGGETEEDGIGGMLDAFEKKLEEAGDGEDAEAGPSSGGRNGQLSVRSFIFGVPTDSEKGIQQRFSLSFSALLQGHDSHVSSLSWSAPSSPSKHPTLLTTSYDNSLIVWSPPPPTSPIWSPTHRLGHISQRGLGFFGALWAGKDEKMALASGWAGGWNVWVQGDGQDWAESRGVTGHYDGVKGVEWGSDGKWIISASTDSTTRIHAPHITNSEKNPKSLPWSEIGRPQIHGYELVGVAPLVGTSFASGADEKIVRVFESTRGFEGTLKGLRGDAISADESKPVGASVPPLGLSNKRVTQDEADNPAPEPKDIYQSTHFSISSTLTTPPTETELSSSTLWPEIEKLYGHGYEVFSIAASHTKDLVASSCKATTKEHAVVRLYDTKSWRPCGVLEGHNLSVTSIVWSRDDKRIVTVSRDRTWRLYERDMQGAYQPIQTEKPHARIIWDVAFSPDSKLFATASRDKTVKIWSYSAQDSKWVCISTIKLDDAATAVCFSQLNVKGNYVLAIGLEGGEIGLWTALEDKLDMWTSSLLLDKFQAHHGQVAQIRFQPLVDVSEFEECSLRIASCSEDHSVKINEVVLSL